MKAKLSSIPPDNPLIGCDGNPLPIDLLKINLQTSIKDERYEDAMIYQDEINKQMTIVQQIHSDIDNSINELLSNLQNDAELDLIKPRDISSSEFKRLVNEYQLYYPQNTFITEKQIKEICQKYNLVLGDMFAFEQSIPDKNKQEIERFKLLDRHDFINSLGISRIEWVNSKGIAMPKDSAYELAMFIANEADFYSLIYSFSFSNDGSIEFDLIPLKGDELGKTETFYLNENMGVVISENENYNQYEPKYSPCADDVLPPVGINDYSLKMETYDYGGFRFPITDKPYKVNFIIQLQTDESDTTLSISLPTEIVQEFSRELTRNEFSIMNPYEFQIKLDLDINLLAQIFLSISRHIGNSKISQVVDRKVIAPIDVFSNCVFQDDYKLRFDLRQYRNQMVNIPDPIILQPVKGGYLVITKWGDESGLIESSNSN